MRIKFSLLRILFYIIVFLIDISIPLEYIETRSFCIFYNLFGITCPGCGTTRAIFNMIHFNFARAVHFNFMGVILFSILVLLLIEDILVGFRLMLFKKNVNPSIIESLLCNTKFFQKLLPDMYGLNKKK